MVAGAARLLKIIGLPCGSASLPLRCALEGLGTGLLLLVATLSAVLPERLWAWSSAPAFAVPIACSLLLLIQTAFCLRISGAHFNPALSLAAALDCELDVYEASLYAAAQVAGALSGIVVAQYALNLDAVQAPAPVPASLSQCGTEFLAVFFFVFAARAGKMSRHPYASGVVIAAAFLLVSLTTPKMSFANPAASLARTLTTNALAVSPQQAAADLCAQLIGVILASLLLRRMRRFASKHMSATGL